MNRADQVISINDIKHVRILVAFSSFFLSVFAFYTDDIINSDGILYIHAAKAFLEGGLTQTQLIYDWPFYPILIACTHWLSSASFETSAIILNTILFLLLTDALTRIAYQLVDNRSQFFFSAVLILCFYPLNEYRDFIVRDIGYWAFTSLAIVYFIRYLETSSFYSGIAWQFSIIVATLFRIEGIVILAALPLFVLIQRDGKPKIKQIFELTSISLIATFSYFSYLIVSTGSEVTFGKMDSLSKFLDAEKILTRFDNKTDLLAENILNKFSAEYSPLILASGLITMLLSKLITAFSFSYVLLSSWSIFQPKKVSIDIRLKGILFYFVLINLFILLGFLFNRYFISTRYSVMLLIAVLLLFIPTVSRMMEHHFSSGRKFAPTLIILLLTFSVADTFYQSNHKDHIRQAAIWANQNLPENSLILTDDQFLNYYFHSVSSSSTLCVGPIYQARRDVDYRGVSKKQRQRCAKYNKKGYLAFDYLLINEERKNKKLQSFLKEHPFDTIYEASNERGDKAVIYRINKQDQS